METLPEALRPYRRTDVFTENSVPAGLLRSHATKAGVWAKIVVLDGRLLYRILEPAVEEVLLDPARCGVVEPGRRHEVEPRGQVRFYVEFYRAPDAG